MTEYDKQLQAHIMAIGNLDGIEQEFRLGRVVFVVDPEGDQYKGVVYVIYATYYCMRDHGVVPEGWYEGQIVKPLVPKDSGPWYGILLHEGGAVVIDQKRLKTMNPVIH